jgi:hypothetical protein
METKCCIYESPTENKSVYDRTAKELCIRSNPTTILKRKNYFTVRCCGLPMKRMIVQIVKFSDGERKDIKYLEYGECSCCGKQITDAETKILKRFFKWLREKFTISPKKPPA